MISILLTLICDVKFFLELWVFFIIENATKIPKNLFTFFFIEFYLSLWFCMILKKVKFDNI